jgi:hypothetical protein
MTADTKDLEPLTDSGWRLAIACALLLAIGSAPIFLRSFVNDDSTYALVARKLAAGGLLYRDAVDNKPPLIYLTFAAAYGLFGNASLAAVKLLAIAVDLACAGLILVIGRRLFGARVGALAALFFSAAAVTGLAEDFAAPNTECFMNLFLLAGLALLSRDPEHPRRRALLAAGILVGVASLYRLQGAVALLAWMAFFFLRRRPLKPPFLVVAAWIVGGFLLPLAVAAGIFTARGTWSDLWLWAVRNNFSYVNVGAAHFGWRPLARIALIAASQLPWLAAAVAAGAFWLRTREPERGRTLLIWLHLLAALFAYQTGTRFYGHYFLQVVPFVCLMAAWAVANLPRPRLPWLRFVPHAMVVWLCVFSVANAARLSRPWDADGALAVAATLKADGARDGDVLLWSAPPDVAWESGRGFATRFAFNNYLTGRIFGTPHNLPDATRAGNRALESADGWRLFAGDLAASRPAFVVDRRLPGFEARSYPLLDEYLRRYYAAPVRVGRYDVYRRL